MNRSGFYGRILALIVCAALFCAAALPGLADGEENGGVLDEAALTELVEGFLREQGIPTDRVGVGFCLPETGEEWFYNPDTWFYPASVYKVPLMMILAERVSSGMVDPAEQINGLELDKVFSYILTYSNNDWAHEVRIFLGGDESWRTEAKQFAGLPDDYYDPDYMDYCYFTPRYVTRVMETLYADPDTYPGVIDCMLLADQAHYFRLADEMHQIPVAQKYGSYSDMQGTDWNHTTGIIYTAHPFILTVMTRNVPNYEWVLGHFALIFTDYVQSLEDKITPYVEEKEEQEAEAAQEAERLAAEQAAEEERQAAERAREQREREEREARRLAEERRQQDRAARLLVLSLLATLAGLVILSAIGLAYKRSIKKKRAERYRRYEEQLRQERADR